MYQRKLYEWYKYTARENRKLMHKNIVLFDPLLDRRFILQALFAAGGGNELPAEKGRKMIIDTLQEPEPI